MVYYISLLHRENRDMSARRASRFGAGTASLPANWAGQEKRASERMLFLVREAGVEPARPE